MVIAGLQLLYLLLFWSAFKDFFFPSPAVEEGTLSGSTLLMSGLFIGPVILAVTFAHAHWGPASPKYNRLLRSLRIAFAASAITAFLVAAILYVFS
jgi:hypothetical protein